MDAKYTPGPWKFLKEFGRVETESEVIAYVAGRVKPEFEIAFANGRLIAAAPELLEALEAIVASAHNGNEPGQTWIMIAGGLIDSAEAAIRKAKAE